MNKTVNINLANTFFHIDEEAYSKLRRYLEAIKRSFSGTAGSDEIIADIEARIAELFGEKMEHDRQVITMKEVDAVINVMGQPEDYMVDEDIFEDEIKPKSKATKSKGRVKKLYRDMNQKYIGGVCSGLEHYLGFDALWIRIIFILLAVFGSGFGLIAYILLWILVPEAATTSQKLDMRGEPINISNIERKVKEGFDDVADKVKSVDYEKMGDQVKSSSKTFFDTIGDIFMFLFKILGKFVGILLIIIGITTLIGLFIGLFTVGVLDVGPFPWDAYDIVNTTGAPMWIVSLLTFFAVGIPFFFLFYLGLKILVTNLKSIGNIAKYSLLGLWLISVGILAALGVRQAAAHAFTGTSTVNEKVVMDYDTINIKMREAESFDLNHKFSVEDMKIAYDENGNTLLYSEDVRFDIRKSEDSVVRLRIKKDADGASFEEARERAGNIDYGYSFNGNQIILNEFLTTGRDNQFRDQEVRNVIYIPEGKVIVFDESAENGMGWSTKNDRDFYRRKIVDYQWVMGSDGELKCLDCPDDLKNRDDDENHIIINEDGIDIDVKDGGESFKMKIDEDGVEIKADDN